MSAAEFAMPARPARVQRLAYPWRRRACGSKSGFRTMRRDDNSVTDMVETLDPADWDAMQALAHRAVDDGFAWLKSVRERPVWRPTPDAVVARFHEPLPQRPQGAESAYQDFIDWVLP